MYLIYFEQKFTFINYSNTTKNNIGLLFIDFSASRRKPSSGLTSGAGRQYVKACPICGSTGRYRVKTVNVSTLERQEGHWEQKNIVKKWIASQESSLEQKRPGQPVSATNLQSQIMFAMRIM